MWRPRFTPPLLLGLLLVAGQQTAAVNRDEAATPLSPEHEQWLERVEPLILPEERAYFLELEESYQRDAFIERFWEVRDPDRSTRLNELKVNWNDRAEVALAEFGDLADARAIAYLLNGPPGRLTAPDGRPLSRCYHVRDEIEVWFYGGSARTSRNFAIIFQKPSTRRPYEVWLPGQIMQARGRSRLATRVPSQLCRELLGYALAIVSDDPFYPDLIREVMAPPEVSSEWIKTFHSFTTELPEDATTFGLDAEFQFIGRKQSRTVVQGIVSVTQEELGAVGGGEGTDREAIHLILLTGEVVRDDRLFESFRYRYELPVGAAGAGTTGQVPLPFQRYLRPGPARVILKVEDLTTDRFARIERQIEIPSSDEILPSLSDSESDFLAMFREANDATGSAAAIRIVPPMKGEIHVGATRFTTVAEGPIESVAFLLDDKPLLTKRRAPYSVELNLGSVAASHLLRVEAFDAAGVEVASDELLVNQGGQRFRVRLVEPRPDRTYRESLVAVAQVEIPDGATLERLEVFLDERRLATLYQEPFELPILLEGQGLAYVRAVAYLEDGNSTEDVAFVNAPDVIEQVEVQYVELFANVFDSSGRPILGLDRNSFVVLEDGIAQTIRRFEYVESLPVHAMLLLDTSSSMEDALDRVTDAARVFAESIVQSKDRLGLLSFASQPRVELRFTNVMLDLAQALTRLKAEGGTALYDSLVFALNYFHGIKGQKALLLLSDGEDESSRFDFDTTLEIARRAGVMTYVIGLEDAAKEKSARKVLRELADTTGGLSFFIEDLDELPGIYRRIEEELRSQYMIAYQSTSEKGENEFRRIEVRLAGRDGEVRAMAGYYP